MSASIHDKLRRVRRPRVHITYEVETEGAETTRELPFVVGVLGDFSGQSTKEQPALADRKFVQIDRDNFDDVMGRISPALQMQVENCLSRDGGAMGVDLHFNSMEDFEPGRVLDQIPALKALLDIRNRLRDLLSKADRSEQLELLLEQILSNPDSIRQLSRELGQQDAQEG